MKLDAVHIHPYVLPLRRPLRTARGVFLRRDGFVLQLCSEGRSGFGDAAAWPGFGSDAAAVNTARDGLQELLRGNTLPALHDLPAYLAAHLWPPEVQHAVELACLDLLAQQGHVSVANLLTDSPRDVQVHTLVHDGVGAQQAVRHGASAVKVKVGSLPLADDVVRVGAIRAAIGSTTGLRLDANGAWDLSTARRAVRMLAAYLPEWIEQPVQSVSDMAALRVDSPVPLAVDECAQNAADLDRVIAQHAADVVVLKPMFAGGLLNTLALARRAQQAGIATMVTHALESAVGRRGAWHVAAALPGAPLACGLGDPLATDVCAGPDVVNGLCAKPSGIGLGVHMAGAAPC